jgi:hypothetical protein
MLHRQIVVMQSGRQRCFTSDIPDDKGSVSISAIISAKGNLKLFGLKRFTRIGLKRSRGAVNFVPEIVAGERDMSPWERSDLGKQLVGDDDPWRPIAKNAYFAT